MSLLGDGAPGTGTVIVNPRPPVFTFIFYIGRCYFISGTIRGKKDRLSGQFVALSNVFADRDRAALRTFASILCLALFFSDLND
jgi:hypothetical protein